MADLRLVGKRHPARPVRGLRRSGPRFGVRGRLVPVCGDGRLEGREPPDAHLAVDLPVPRDGVGRRARWLPCQTAVPRARGHQTAAASVGPAVLTPTASPTR
jgi:hypothetical protein